MKAEQPDSDYDLQDDEPGVREDFAEDIEPEPEVAEGGIVDPDPEPRRGLEGGDLPPALPAPPIVLPPASSGDDPGFRIVALTVGLAGSVRARVAYQLNAKVYNRTTAMRFASAEAKGLSADEAVYVVCSPTGRALGVFAAGTGRPVTGAAGRRAKRMVADLLPDMARTPRRRRTSRKPRSTRVRHRRTSRRPAKKGSRRR